MTDEKINKKRKVSVLAITSYCLSILYLILKYYFNFLFGNQHIVDYIFIYIHLGVIIFGLIGFAWIYFSVYVYFLIAFFKLNKKIKDSDVKQVKVAMKTMPQRIGLGLLYWLLPIGLYCYYIYQIKYLYIFIWLPVWYPILYYLIEKYIKNKELKIGSPNVQYWEKEDDA